jgi:three-Cys-motif partner protein
LETLPRRFVAHHLLQHRLERLNYWLADHPLPDMDDFGVDDIGPWSERKHDIISAYGEHYSTILTNAKRRAPFQHSYIDGFAGAGVAKSRETGEIVEGSPLRVLSVVPPFNHYYFVEKDAKREAILRSHVAGRPDVDVILGDANDVVPRLLSEKVRFGSFGRAFVLLDPWRLSHLLWSTIVSVAANRATDLLLHFPTMDAQRNVLLRDQSKVDSRKAKRLTAYWGDESWRQHAWAPTKRPHLFAEFDAPEKQQVAAILAAFCERLKWAGFRYAADPIPMRNSKGPIVYHLIFAVHHETAERVAKYVSRKFRS